MRLLINMAIVLLFLTSCEKVIDVNLNSVSKKYVIEGFIIDQPGRCEVRITQTKDFDEDNNFSGVSGAVVTVSDNGAAPVTLTETSLSGTYSTTALNGTSGHTYQLTVTIGEQTFTASSKMPVLVPFADIFIEERSVFDGTKKVTNIIYNDPVGKGNGYHFIEYRNGVRTKTVFASSDDFTDGKEITRPLLTFDEEEEEQIKSGDEILVVMECVDQPIYKYWYSLDAAAGSGGSATPANPVTNISGGALGYFSAHTEQTRGIKVP